jgi:small subunit ribosomal protein S18
MAYPQQRRPKPAEGATEENGQKRYVPVKKSCPFCADKELKLDYKNTDLLRRFVTDRGKIKARRKTGACAKHQRAVSEAVKRARHIALLPFVADPQRTN